jgi:hypothetical protein
MPINLELDASQSPIAIDLLVDQGFTGDTGPARAALLVADTAARLALTVGQATGAIVVQENDSSAWTLVDGGNPAAVGDWVEINIVSESLNVRSYGAVGDGVTNDSAAIQTALNAAAASTSTRVVYFPPGTYKCNVLVPDGLQLVGAGTRISGTVPNVSSTKMIPNNDTLPVLWVKILEANSFYGIDIIGNGEGVSVAGLRIANDAGTYCGMGLFCHRIRVTGFTNGFHIVGPNAITFLECTAVYNTNGWRGEFLSDTWEIINCHGDFNSGPQIYAEGIRSISVRNGDWGNCQSPLLLASGGGVVIFEGTIIESVDHTHLFEMVNTSLVLRGNRIAAQAGNPNACIVRQTTFNAFVSIENNRLNDFSNYGTFGVPLLWETSDANAPAPSIVGPRGALRLQSSDFTTTVREWHSHLCGVLAYRTANQTITPDSFQIITWSAKQDDAGQNFDPATGLFTAPTTGWYALSVSIVVNESNTGFTRIKERINGVDASIIDSANNHEAFRPLVGTRIRYLTRGQTWGVSIFHNKSSNMTVRGTNAAEDSTISIVRMESPR